MKLKQNIVIWYDENEKRYFLDCEQMFLKRKKNNPKISLITRLNVTCEKVEELSEVLNVKNLCILPEVYEQE